MRNLQKILALVLALVMSLSLMATAGAEFTDQADIDEAFAESVNVLNGLEVFQGYPTGDFQPKGNITRAEVAAIIYRIATGDVDDTQVDIYADYDKFSDVYASETYSGWAAGYINYCANAEYIKGRGDGKFYPQDKVTGYEALAMILRVVGYDKNGEFTGADWAVQTAAIANQKGVTKNVNSNLLGQPATREMVAELLCKAILIPTVNYTLAFGYQESDETIAYKTFQMECLTGVVTGNEVADLETNGATMSSNQTRLVVDGETKVVNIPTGLDSLGKSVRAYIRPQAGTSVKELVSGQTYETNDNVVYDEFKKVSSISSAASSVGISNVDNAKHFINYDQATQREARIRIRYVVMLEWSEYQAMYLLATNGSSSNQKMWAPGVDYKTADPTWKTADLDDAASWNTQRTTIGYYTYEKVIDAFTTLTDQDYAFIRDTIFAKADKNAGIIKGEVYVGTTSVDNKDLSDQIRFEDFEKTYLDIKENKLQVSNNGLGNRLIIIDNNNDGSAEYVLQTRYTIAKIAADGSLDIAGVTFADDDSAKNDMWNNVAIGKKPVSVSGKELVASDEALNPGDVVIYAYIDGNARAQKAETATEKVNTVNRADKTVTVTGDEGAATYTESAVHTHSDSFGSKVLKSGVTNMAGNTTYTMFFDLDGNLAAFTEEIQNNLVLITNGWYNSTISGPEYAVQYYRDGQLQTAQVNSNGSYFIKNSSANANSWNNLKDDFGAKTTIAPNGNINNQGDRVHTIVANLEGNVLTPVDKAYLYAQNLRVLDMKNNVIPGRDNATVSLGTPYRTEYAQPTAYQTDDEGTDIEVRAMSNTVYYTVYRGNGTDPMIRDGLNVVVREYTGYNALPNIDRTYIEDVYAIGAKATAYNNSTYYTAQIVVIELNDKYTDSRSESEQVFIPDFHEVTGNVGEWENVSVIRGDTGVVETVKIDLNNSTLAVTYDPANGMSSQERLPGLYYMDLKDGSSDVYVIEWMDSADIRANNYRAGYITKSTDLVSDNYVQVQMMVQSQQNAGWVKNFTNTYVNVNYPVRVTDDSDIARLQTGTVTSNSMFYNLSYSSSVASLSAPSTAPLVLAQDKGDGINCLVKNTLNERWVRNTDDFTNDRYNEVLIRCDAAGNIIWAISFAEGSATSVNYAQQVWYNCLPAATAETDLAFYGVKDAKVADTNDQDPAGYAITVSYNTAVNSGKLLNLKGINATIANYRIERLDNGTWDNGVWTDITGDPEITEVQNLNPAVTKTYRLTVTRNTGKVEVYKLIQQKQSLDGALAHDPFNADNIRVLSTPDGYRYDSPAEASDKDAIKANVWIKEPNRFDIGQLEEYLTFDGQKSVKVFYVENAAGDTVSTDKVINNAIDFDDNGDQADGKIVVEVTNLDGYKYYIQLNFSTELTNSVEGARVAAINDLDAFVKAQAERLGLTVDEVKNDAKLNTGIETIKSLINSSANPESIFHTYGDATSAASNPCQVHGDGTAAGSSTGYHYGTDSAWQFFEKHTTTGKHNTGCLKSDLLAALSDYKTAKGTANDKVEADKIVPTYGELGTDKKATITTSGTGESNIDAFNNTYKVGGTTPIFNGIDATGKANLVGVKLDLQKYLTEYAAYSGTTKFEVKQTNDALSVGYPSDPMLSSGVKTSTNISYADMAEFCVLLKTDSNVKLEITPKQGSDSLPVITVEIVNGYTVTTP